MAGNSIGQLFKVTTFGESHGIALGCIIDGVPPKMSLNEDDLQKELDRRKPGTSAFTTQRRESDRVKILSGVFDGQTTGTSIGLIIENEDQRSQDYTKIATQFRPSHADFTYQHKYGIRDYRGGGRASARETAMRVAAGAIAKKYLFEQFGILIRGYLAQMGTIYCDPLNNDLEDIQSINWNEVNQNPFFCANHQMIPKLESYLKALKKEGNSIGAKLKIIAENVPIGLGEPVFDRLDADLAHALMSINAVKGVEIGDGFAVVEKTGTENRDELTANGFLSNHAGGILGGISSGAPIITTIALKPTSSIAIPARSLDIHGNEITIATKGRHDPCVGLRAVPIAEAMVAIVLMDHLLRYRSQCCFAIK